MFVNQIDKPDDLTHSLQVLLSSSGVLSFVVPAGGRVENGGDSEVGILIQAVCVIHCILLFCETKLVVVNLNGRLLFHGAGHFHASH